MVRVINYSGRQCFSLSDGASNKLFRTKINSIFIEFSFGLCYTNERGDCMRVQTGYLYHIKDEFFDIVNDEKLMTNHERGKKRPTYFTIRENDILWFIPLSSKINKYQKIIDSKIQKYGHCDTILIREILGKKSVILLQNSFPTLENYIDHVHLLENGKPAKVIKSLKDEILKNFKYLLKFKSKGINLFFADIDKIKNQMLDEVNVKI